MTDDEYRIDLPEQMERGQVVLFIGAGISIGAGLPGWATLVRPLAEEIGARWPANDGDLTTCHLLTVAQYYENQRGRNDLIRYLRDKLDTTLIQPTTVHRLVKSLPVRTIFTTNIDDLIEKTFRDQTTKRFQRIVGATDLTYGETESVQLIKLCGDLQQPESIVLTRHDFNTYFIVRHRLAERLRTTLENQIALFLGYSLQDPFINQIWDNIGLDFGRHRRLGYAVLFDVTSLEMDDLRRRGIRVIHLETRGRDRSTVLEEWIRETIANPVNCDAL